MTLTHTHESSTPSHTHEKIGVVLVLALKHVETDFTHEHVGCVVGPCQTARVNCGRNELMAEQILAV